MKLNKQDEIEAISNRLNKKLKLHEIVMKIDFINQMKWRIKENP